MATARGTSFRTVVSTAVACTCLRVVAADPQGVTPSVEPPRPPAVQASAAASVAQPSPRLRTIHRQVSRLPLTGDYRAKPAGTPAAVAAYEKIQAALQRPLDGDVEFNESSLRDVAGSLREKLGVPVLVDRKALEDAGLDPDCVPITSSSQGMTARAALRQILGDLDLTWTIRDEALLITTKEQAAEMLDIRLYPLPLSCATQGAVDLQSLFDLVQNTVAPATWTAVGGPGSIQPFGDGAATALIVRQTAGAHDELESLLRGLHERDLAEFAASSDAPAGGVPTVRVYHVADETARGDLARKLVELCNGSLRHGADQAARVSTVGDCLAVHSVSPEFHALAGQMIRAIAGEQIEDGWPAGMGRGPNDTIVTGAGGVF